MEGINIQDNINTSNMFNRFKAKKRKKKDISFQKTF